MNKKLITVIIAVTLLAVFALPQASYALGKHSGYGDKGSYYSGSGCKFYKTVHKILEKRKELDLSKEQVAKIRKLSADVKKSLINQDAKIKTLKVEINTLMWEFPFETAGVNEIIAQQYDLKTKKAQYVISAYDKLKAILSEEQIAKVKEL